MKLAELAAAALLLAFAAPPALAQAISPEIDKTLWCASAFYWLAGSAEDAGDTAEAALYDRWSGRLLDVAGAALTNAGFQPERIEELVTEYDEAALAQIGLPDAPHDVTTCPNLLGDWK